MGLLYRLFHGGYDRDGYDRDGYDRGGYDRDDYDRDGYDRDDYDRDGYDRDGYGRYGYNRDGYGRDGYNRDGYDRDGYGRYGCDRDGYNRDGYNRDGYDRDGYNKDGFSRLKIHKSILNSKFVMPEGISCSNYSDCSGCKDLFMWNKPIEKYYNIKKENIYVLDCDNCCFRNASFTEIKYSTENQILFIVKIQEGISCLNPSAFSYKEWFKEVYLPESIKVIPEKTFSNCKNLDNISLPKSLESIGKHAFEFCTKLSTIELKENMEIIGEFAFRVCSNLRKVSIYSNQITAYMNSFYGCKNLTDVYYNSDKAPKSIAIPYITNLYLGEKVSEFTNEAIIFKDKKLPSDLSEIKIKINVSQDNPYLVMENGVLFSKNKSTLISFNCHTSTAYKIPSYVIDISDFAFANTKLKRIEFHDGIRKFNASCIYGLVDLDIVANKGSYVSTYIKENELREEELKNSKKRQEIIQNKILEAQCGPRSQNTRHTIR
jgi:hypothetical protein